MPKITTVILTALVLLGLCAPASAQLDLFAEPAQSSPRAARSVMLALGRAGDRLVAVGERGIVLTSDDYGVSWAQAKVPVSVTLTGVSFASARRGWAIGHGGVVLRSDDGGRSWRKQLDGRELAEIELAAARTADNRTTRQGQRRLRDAQRLVESGPDKPFLDVFFFDEHIGLVVGAYGLVFSTDDGGETWRSLVGDVPNPMGMHLYAIHPAGDDLYLAGEQGVVFRAEGIGHPFEQVETPYEGSFFGLLSDRRGALLLLGLRGNALRSTNDGDHWSAVDMDVPATLTAGTVLRNGDLVLVNEAGQVLHSAEAGGPYRELHVDQPTAFTDVVEAADGTLVLSGVRGLARIETAARMTATR